MLNCLLFICVGGSTLYIETALRRMSLAEKPNGKTEGSLELTGHLGDVMKESARIAMTVARNFMAEIDPVNEFLHTNHIHLHVPEVRYNDVPIPKFPIDYIFS